MNKERLQKLANVRIDENSNDFWQMGPDLNKSLMLMKKSWEEYKGGDRRKTDIKPAKKELLNYIDRLLKI